MSSPTSFWIAVTTSEWSSACEVEGLLGGVLGHFDDGVDHRLHAAVGEHQGVQHDLFRQLLGFGFDHHQGVLGAGDDQVELASRAVWSSVGFSTNSPSM